ncbi:HAMP domain-containing protein [candidate division KSB1 bacterium]|nr:HAMP domain-containing protein [candidate division KSB1 bacterium]NIR72630.1 HAMP domain-containing protein [candidate division KSB1 bacterium]NIS27341.1 HAMP domain-containing protein [candidate division KSB1 bacterium]NIT73554.1 HAMP domain-containing protein [candidate division KSB1 bacterium]NIU25402.1 HAMP domain-containing protein [candidate division KSB1 bacterium]
MVKLSNKIKIRHRLLTRLLVSHILIASLPLFFTGKVLVDSAKNSIERTILERNLEFTRRSTQLIELKLETAKDILRSQARSQAIYELNRNTVDLAINTIVSEFDLFDKITVFDTLNNVVATTSFEHESFESFSSNGVSSTLLAGLSYQSDVYVTDERLPMMDIAEPLKRHGEIVGILYATVDLKAMWDLVQENVVGEKGQAFVFNQEGVYVAHSDRKYVYSKKTFKNPTILEQIRLGRDGDTIYRTDENVEMVAAYAPIGNYGWGFMIQQPTSEAFAHAESMRTRIIQFMMGTILLASLLAYLYTRWMVRPVDHLVWGMEQFSKGELDYRIEKVSSDEIGTLAENFNEMADRLIEFQNTMKRTERLQTLGKLASVLSHEIRNPLNSMVINMQILKRELSKEVVNRTRVEKFYDVLSTEIKRVDQLVKDFLLIARPQSPQKNKIALNDLLDEVLMMHAAESLKKGVRIERDYVRSSVIANVDEAKLKQVFANLIINSIQAMPGGGKLIVGLKKSNGRSKSEQKQKGKSVLISFKDTGVGIPKEDLSKIFDFYYSTKDDGTGLGLAIVQQIVEDHGGTISVNSRINEGTVFTIRLPRE